jgi:hypothetical protein
MLFSMMLLFALRQIPDAPVAKPQSAPPAQSAESAGGTGTLELEGDQLGEDLEAFKARHAKAECDTTPARGTCYQWADVAISGMRATPGAGCNLKKRYAADCLQGLTARFTEQRLTALSYTVSGADLTEAVAALRKKFGAPTTESRESASWNKGDASLSVVSGKDLQSGSGPTLITIAITTTN